MCAIATACDCAVFPACAPVESSLWRPVTRVTVTMLGLPHRFLVSLRFHLLVCGGVSLRHSSYVTAAAVGVASVSGVADLHWAYRLGLPGVLLGHQDP